MKKIILTLAITSLIVFTFAGTNVYAQMGSMMDNNDSFEGSTEHLQSVETVLQSLLDQQNVSTIQQLDLSKISDDQWEELGDAVMETYRPGEAHEEMDQMMGGEGSESLREMHINMGKNYLIYGNSYGGYGMVGGAMGMMGGNMMYYRNNPYHQGCFMGVNGMMGYGNGIYSINGILSSLVSVTALVFFLAGAYYFIKKARK